MQVSGKEGGFHPTVLDSLRHRYRRAGDRMRRLLNGAVLGQVQVRDGHVVEAAYKGPFDLLFSSPKFEYGDVVERTISYSSNSPELRGRVRGLVVG